jgi:peptidoglycan/xylan/chitin deacetylase (PgdA/CDA1 family)
MAPWGLTYHDVTDDPASSGFQGPAPDHYKLTVAEFTRQLDAIAALSDPPRLTFDDGGSSAAATARMLEERGLRGHFFVVSSLVGTPGFADAQTLREVAARGHEIGSHSHTHPCLARLPPDESFEELRRSKATLEELLERPVVAFSAPRGLYNRRLGALAARAGYETLYTSEPWTRPRVVDGAAVFGRFSVTRRTPLARVLAFARGDRIAVAREAAGWYALKAGKAAAWPVYVRLRAALLARR